MIGPPEKKNQSPPPPMKICNAHTARVGACLDKTQYPGSSNLGNSEIHFARLTLIVPIVPIHLAPPPSTTKFSNGQSHPENSAISSSVRNGASEDLELPMTWFRWPNDFEVKAVVVRSDQRPLKAFAQTSDEVQHNCAESIVCVVSINNQYCCEKHLSFRKINSND